MVPICCLLPLWRFQLWFLGGAPAWRVSSAPCSSRFLVLWRFYGALASFWPSWRVVLSGGDCWTCEPIGPGLIVWTWCVYSPSSLDFLGGLLGLLKVLAELNRIDFTAMGIYSDLQTRYIYQGSCRNNILILFDCQMLLVLLLLYVGGGK